MKPTFITLLALCLCLGGCGKKEPAQPSATNPEVTKPEPTKAKAVAGVKLWGFETGGDVRSSPAIGFDGTVYVGSMEISSMPSMARLGSSYGDLKRDIGYPPPSPSVLMARFTSGHRTTRSMPSRPIPKALPKARGLCVGRMRGIRGVQSRPIPYTSLVSPNNPPCVRT